MNSKNKHSLRNSLLLVFGIISAIVCLCILILFAYGMGRLNEKAIQQKAQTDAIAAAKSTQVTGITADELFHETNAERQKAGLNMLDYSPYLEASASDKCADMVKRNYWQHNAPDGTQPWVFIKKYLVSYDKAGENLAYGYKDSQSVMTNWMNSPTHKVNILEKNFTEVGFGICTSKNYMDEGPTTLVVQHFVAN